MMAAAIRYEAQMQLGLMDKLINGAEPFIDPHSHGQFQRVDVRVLNSIVTALRAQATEPAQPVHILALRHATIVLTCRLEELAKSLSGYERGGDAFWATERLLHVHQTISAAERTAGVVLNLIDEAMPVAGAVAAREG
jgi:hypothetical protein